MDLRKLICSSNFILRSATVLIMAPVVLWIVYAGGIIYNASIIIIAVLMAYEWHELTSSQQDKSLLIWRATGIIYITLPCLAMIWLREQEKGREIVYWLLSVIWATDIFAYICGSLIGGWKIAPKISPNKTWSGLIGGVVAATIVGWLTGTIAGSQKPEYLIGLSAILGVYGQIGDFVESWIKRKFNAKDSGNVIPGHGGILDRVDSLVPVAPKVAMVVFFDKWGIF